MRVQIAHSLLPHIMLYWQGGYEKQYHAIEVQSENCTFSLSLKAFWKRLFLSRQPSVSFSLSLCAPPASTAECISIAVFSSITNNVHDSRPDCRHCMQARKSNHGGALCSIVLASKYVPERFWPALGPSSSKLLQLAALSWLAIRSTEGAIGLPGELDPAKRVISHDTAGTEH